MNTHLKMNIRTCSRVFTGACIVMAFLMMSLHASGQDAVVKGRKPVVLVPPFENQSKQHENIVYEVGTGIDPNKPKRRFTVDRYTQAPRTLIENVLGNMEGVTIVERQRVDTLLAESEFGQLSGIVDSEKAIKLGKLLGANLIVVGTIVNISDETKKFNGYGITTENTQVTCQMRFRLLEIETGEVTFSKVVKGSKSYSKSSFGQTKNSDRNFAAIEATIEKMAEDADFRAAIFGKKTKSDAESTSGLIEVDFSPKPENCDIEIDGKYVGGSPVKRRLKSGMEYKIHISKSGYKDWTGTIVPEAGLRITRELERNP